ncbi:SMI1/KNR4 family protein SUKH-1 [Primorskyibacter sedentarius]|uniref:SMI1/KNR4 family protein SUKH-1 n=1 Tax=Primorskyibacter sedentarius TaxID=745311 RepID=A0A4R3INZ2_9RHOB|nr:SMI1/KNR4 family protein [Primorskyibacter sedentarius]TCS50797.1 SMI1/KNR4 family protein SUKH-1 [Primorskyibacter sedentarius]
MTTPLDLLERVLDARLPPAYRDWLAKRNGQTPENRLVTFTQNGRESSTTLHALYAVNTKHTYNDLWYFHANFGQDLRPWYLSIGSDDGGNQIVIALKGPNHGKVFFRDHEVPLDVGMHIIAPSFEAFLAGLTTG